MLKRANLCALHRFKQFAARKFASDAPRPQKILMPDVGEQTGKILRWYVQSGSKVSKDETICDVETENFEFELEAEEDGYILEILEPEGTGREIQIGDTVAKIVSTQEELSLFANEWKINYEKTRKEIATFCRVLPQIIGTCCDETVVSTRAVSVEDITKQACLTHVHDIPLAVVKPTDVYSLDTSSGHVLEDAEVNLNEGVHDYHRLIYEQRPSTSVILSLKTPATLAFSSLSNLNLSMASKFACRFESEIAIAKDSSPESIVEACKNNKITTVCVPNHGFVLMSRTIPRILTSAETLETAIRIELLGNGKLREFSQKEVQEEHLNLRRKERMFSVSRFERWSKFIQFEGETY